MGELLDHLSHAPIRVEVPVGAGNGLHELRVGAEGLDLEPQLLGQPGHGDDDLQLLSADEARVLEPDLACVAALLSPSTGVVDSHGFMQALEGHISSRGGQVVLNTRVTGAEARPAGGFSLTIDSGGEDGRITAERLVNAAGLGATAIGDMVRYASTTGRPRPIRQRATTIRLADPCPSDT